MAVRRAEAVKVDIITIFPEYFGPLRVSLLGKAAERGLIDVAVHDLRTWAHDVHKSVDDTPFGGGPGMVMSPVPWGEALDAVLASGSPGTRLVVPTPAGIPFRQETAATYARMAHLVFACGRYEGIDARFAEDALIEHHNRICGEHDGRAEGARGDQFGFGCGHAGNVGARRFVGEGRLIDGGRNHRKRKSGVAQDLCAAWRRGSEDQFQHDKGMPEYYEEGGAFEAYDPGEAWRLSRRGWLRDLQFLQRLISTRGQEAPGT